ncbi:hypothetical protein RO3G_07172 [Rhizopus delemar RA 99-880]|uniref:Uncharacterized protein n=1 Tax=Rhizopus delemar (strain RA 99-880 / ATCC MYA-4621 / FGSC 9543 / NRRL 43880) TaxID=246409 RepID=I1C1Y7_RHIO9|nr:hypothetical protein RO3G_07172 [Rhizopus delemar RA 99-880]|eukprot:EIE82467.1 hypothetical protein RO3G_07172 [Rhizopus delemar RA 99-880]
MNNKYLTNDFKDNPPEESVTTLDLPNQKDSTPSLVPNIQSNYENKPECDDDETVV